MNRRKAFTLVELLVVIGIIALLISILLPALGRARESAKTVQCASNMRQMGQAFHLYANQWKGWLPPAATVDWINGALARGLWVDAMLDSRVLPPGSEPLVSGIPWLTVYSIPVMQCPSRSPRYWGEIWSYVVPYKIFGSEKSSGFAGKSGMMSKLSSLRPAPRVILLVESFVGSPSYYAYVENSSGTSSGLSDGRFGWDVRHLKRANFLLADGHVGTYRFNGNIVYNTAWCAIEDWETDVQQLADSRQAIGLQQNYAPF